jgi:ABC-type lipoprotein export system ATPase subunit/GNAT superfamily N-acetyltransferase
MQLEGLFDVPVAQRSENVWDVNLPIEERAWNIGLIVGASGSGKTTLARELFGANLIEGFEWPADKSIVDAFPSDLGIKEITGLLSSVGFSSPPSWLRPFHVLSNGEKFRVTIARALAENKEISVIDEFTSVVDRTVARIGSAAVAKAVRRRGQRIIAVSCHYDIVDWLQPDWIYEPGTDSFQWRELQRHPEIVLSIRRVHRSAWRIFKQHHYLSAELSNSAGCFCGFVDEQPAVFASAIPFPHAIRPGYREHRTVCLPDFQGVGIGNAMSEFVASLYRANGRPYFSATSQPAMIRHRAQSRLYGR